MNWQELWQKIKDNSTDIAFKLIMIALIFIVANILINIISHFTGRTMSKAADLKDRERGKQISTLMTVTRSVSRYLIYFIAILLTLEQIGLGSSLSNLLVTAGVGSLIISLGAQSIINDFLAGMFILFEKQYSVGDYVKIGEFSGTVTSVAMRVTYLRNYEGQKIIVPNGKITSVINYGSAYNLAKLVIPTPYGADTRHLIDVIQGIANTYYEDHRDVFIEQPTVTGVTEYNASSVDITLVGKVIPMNQWETERAWRLLIKEGLEKEGISIPYQTITIEHNK